VWLTQHGYAVASFDYRLSGEAKFPAQIHDCKGAIRFLRAHASDYGYKPDCMAASGASAGGHLAALVATSRDVT
jgi:acetyl esterase/lipase